MAGEKSGGAEGGGSSGGGDFSASSLGSDLVSLDNGVKAAQDAIDRIDTLAERSIVGEVDNLTDQVLTLADDNHQSGAFTSSLPPDTIAPRTNGLFGSKNKFPFQGTVGSVTYRTGDGTEVLCGWNNAFIGDNKINYSVGGAHPGRYDCRVMCGGGNKGAHMRWVIFPLGPPFSLRRMLGERGISNLRDLPSSLVVRLAGFSTKQLLGL